MHVHIFRAEVQTYGISQYNLERLDFTGEPMNGINFALQSISRWSGGGPGRGISPDTIPNNSVLVGGTAFNINSSSYNSTNIAKAAVPYGGLYYKINNMWFNLLDPNAVSKAYFSDQGNAVSPIGVIQEYVGNPAEITGAEYNTGTGVLNISTSGVLSGSTFDPSKLVYKNGSGNKYAIGWGDVESNSYQDGIWTVVLTPDGKGKIQALGNLGTISDNAEDLLDANEGWYQFNGINASADTDNQITVIFTLS